MMPIVAVVMSLALLLLALLHAYWGFGGTWPGTDARSLARTVAGHKGTTKMPSAAACLAVAVALLVAAVWPLLLSAEIGAGLPDWLAPLGGLVLAAVFAGRGILGYLPGWRRRTPELPFARLDRLVCSPLCLALGAGFLALLFDRLEP